MNPTYNLVRITAATNKVVVGDPAANAAEISRMLASIQSDIILFPELCLTGYTCGNLFHQNALLDSAVDNLLELASLVNNQLVIIGVPLRIENALFNCAAVLHNGKIIGVAPKEFIPNYNEFYEG